jgi:hypothetical protein
MGLKDLIGLFQLEVDSKRRKRKKKHEDETDDVIPKKKKRIEIVGDSSEEIRIVEVTRQRKNKKKSKKTDFASVRLQHKRKESANNYKNDFAQQSSLNQNGTQQLIPKKSKLKRPFVDDQENSFAQKHSQTESDTDYDSDVVVVKDLHKFKRRKTENELKENIFNNNSDSNDSDHFRNNNNVGEDGVDVAVVHFQNDSRLKKIANESEENELYNNNNESLSRAKSTESKRKKGRAGEPKKNVSDQLQCNKNTENSPRIQLKGHKCKKLKGNKPEENIPEQLHNSDINLHNNSDVENKHAPKTRKW